MKCTSHVGDATDLLALHSYLIVIVNCICMGRHYFHPYIESNGKPCVVLTVRKSNCSCAVSKDVFPAYVRSRHHVKRS